MLATSVLPLAEGLLLRRSQGGNLGMSTRERAPEAAGSPIVIKVRARSMGGESGRKSRREKPPAGLTTTEEYRPYLDGLRAVAVYLVVMFHAGSTRLAGGYVGVDVFFVLSGFLVTQLLLRDMLATGSISFRRFYSRRVRRLLPAAFVALVVTALVFKAIASPVEIADAAGGFKAAFLYGTNWFFIHRSANYFGRDLTGNPVLHFWSLAVEEQFYLLWPLLLSGLFLLLRRLRSPWAAIRMVVTMGAVASVAGAWLLRTSDPNRAYYGTDTRAYQLMAGALIALTPMAVGRLTRHVRAARIGGVAALAALLVTASAWIHLDAIQRGVAVTVITVVLIIALETAGGGLARGALSRDTVVYLGKISYGTYLWHWPVILVITRSFHLGTRTTIIMSALVATALASLSFELLERPVRLSPLLDRHRTVVIATGLATSILAALVIIPAVTTPSTSAASDASLAQTGFTPVPDLDWHAIATEFSPFPNCVDRPATACTLVQGSGPHVLLIGDSHAAMLVPTFVAVARTEHFTFSASVKGGCPWQRELYVPELSFNGQTVRTEDCRRQREDTYDRVIPALHPDIIVVMNLGYEVPRQYVPYLGPDLRPMKNGSPAWQAWLRQTTVDSLTALRANGRTVVLLEPVPLAPGSFDPLACLSKATVVEQCRYTAPTDPTFLESLYRQLDARDDQVWAADLDKLICPYLPICDPIVDHQVVKLDGSHLTRAFARALAPAVDGYLKTNGIVPR